MKKIKLIIFFFLISFVFSLQLDAKTATCVYNLNNESGSLPNQLKITVDNGKITTPWCSNYGCVFDSINEVNFFKNAVNDESYFCPPVYIKKATASSSSGFKLTFSKTALTTYLKQDPDGGLAKYDRGVPVYADDDIVKNDWRNKPFSYSASESTIDNSQSMIGRISCPYPEESNTKPYIIYTYENGVLSVVLMNGAGITLKSALPVLQSSDFVLNGKLICPENLSHCYNDTIKTFVYSKEANKLVNLCDESGNNNNASSDVIVLSNHIYAVGGDLISFPLGTPKDCSGIIGANGQDIIRIFIIGVRILAPILLFVFTAYEFMKAIPSQDEEAVIKAWKRFGTRAIIVVLIMLLPTFMNIIGKLIGLFDTCGVW